MRIMRIMRIMRLVVGAPYALHYPWVTLRPEPNQTATCKPTGYTETPPILSDKSDRSDKSDASVTPP